MENKAHALAAGVFVVAVSALLIGLAMWLMRDTASTKRYELITRDPVTGLQPQAPVRYKGVAVGKVTEIGFDPDQAGHVRVEIAVNYDAPITRATFATLAFQGVTGLSFIQLDDNGEDAQPPEPGPRGGVPRIPLRPSALGQLQDSITTLAEKVATVADSLNQVLGPDNRASLANALTEIGGAARNISQLAANVDKTVEAQFGPRNSSIPQLVKQTTATMQSVQTAAQEARGVLASLSATADDAQKALARVTAPGGMIDSLGQTVDTAATSTLPRIQQLSEDASRAVRRIDQVADTLGDNPQALLYGRGAVPPGPGEPGFVAPAPTATAP